MFRSWCGRSRNANEDLGRTRIRKILKWIHLNNRCSELKAVTKSETLVKAFHLIPIADADARDQLEASLERILTLHLLLTKYLKHKERSPNSYLMNGRSFIPRYSHHTKIPTNKTRNSLPGRRQHTVLQCRHRRLAIGRRNCSSNKSTRRSNTSTTHSS